MTELLQLVVQHTHRAMLDSQEVQEFPLTPSSRLVLSQGDITKWQGDAIVNAGVVGSSKETSVPRSIIVSSEAVPCLVQLTSAC